MADKKLKTYDVTLTFSFQTKDNDFMNSDFNFDHVCIVMDSRCGGILHLSGNSVSKHPFIICDIKNAFFHCCPDNFSCITSEDLFRANIHHEFAEPLSDCVFCYQPVKGSRFLFGVKEKEFSNEKNKIESPQKSEKFS